MAKQPKDRTGWPLLEGATVHVKTIGMAVGFTGKVHQLLEQKGRTVVKVETKRGMRFTVPECCRVQEGDVKARKRYMRTRG